jgi:tRNA modification GTPase
MNLFDTIAAISTPYGKGGVAMIRISGADAHKVGDKVFRTKSSKKLSEYEHGRVVYGRIVMTDIAGREKVIDDGMAVCFHSPRSFTGEDTVEICCHGGVLVTRKVLSAVLLAGARAAEAGEFTRRAYISGKMKLSEAEALGNLLEAKSDSQLTLARSGMMGKLSEKTDKIYESMRDVLTGIYAAIDFPDEDLSEMSRDEMQSAIEASLADLKSLAATYGTGRAISEGIPTVICGRANAGKSSVYNRILGYEAAIVTDIEGTTRDVLRETAVMGNITLLLCDTAGLRQTDDKVESIGIERSISAIESAGLALAVFDISKSPTDEDRELAEKIKAVGVPAIALLNKCDVVENRLSDFDDIVSGFSAAFEISAAEGSGFEALADAVEALFIDGSIDIENDAVVSGARQYAAICSSAEALERALEDIKSGMALDLCCIGVECSMSALGEVDGREIGEEIVSEIFSKFCVGK